MDGDAILPIWLRCPRCGSRTWWWFTAELPTCGGCQHKPPEMTHEQHQTTRAMRRLGASNDSLREYLGIVFSAQGSSGDAGL